MFVFVLGAAALVPWMRRRRPLRPRRERGPRRLARNAVVAATAPLPAQVLEAPALRRATATVAGRRWGLLQRPGLPPAPRSILAWALLDYTLYLWHVLLHRVPVLWRFHGVHHAGRELDLCTALRFHLGELALTIPWRLLQVLRIGVTARDLRRWQLGLLVSIAYHHANLRLPGRLDRLLATVVMTPRLHGIHHDQDRNIRDAAWSSGLTLWDRLHGSLRLEPGRGDRRVGLPGLAHPPSVRLGRMWLLPLLPGAPSWTGE